MKKLNLKDIKNGMSRSERREVKGGCGAYATWKCCWPGTNNCSQCAGFGSCVSGAERKACGFYEV